MSGLQLAIWLLCAIGFYASVFMLRKSILAAQGRVPSTSVVHTARARIAGVPNALFGIVYYAGVALSTWLGSSRLEWAALAAAALAACASLYLGYSLLFVTKRSCPYCWTAHIVNWCLLAALAYRLDLR